MVFKWNVPGIIPVSADVAGGELNRIYERDGAIDPHVVVQESRKEEAPLHGCFEWDDAVAAEKYRVSQAAKIIRNLTITAEIDNKPVDVRAFVNPVRLYGYEPLAVTMKSPDKMNNLLCQAQSEMQWFRSKYRNLSELQGVFDAMEAVLPKEAAV